MNETNPHCECAVAGYCERHKMEKTERKHQFCQGVASTPDGGLKYWNAWEGGRNGATAPEKPELDLTFKKITPRTRNSGPGSHLFADYKRRGVPGCSSCDALRKKMDAWGVAGCREHIHEIVEEILPRAKGWVKENKPWVHSVLPNCIEETSIRLVLKRDIERAIKESEKNTRKKRGIHKHGLSRVPWPVPKSEPALFTNPIRNLMVHIFPSKGKWEWIIDVLKENDSKFNGRRLVSIVEGGRGIDSFEKVRDALVGFDCEISVRENVKSSGEYVSFEPMFKELKTDDPNQITFYFHSKGAKHDSKKFKHIMDWNNAMLLPLLDLPSVEASFIRGADLVGAFGGDVFGNGNAPMGSFYWFRNSNAPDLVASKRAYYTSEKWPVSFDNKEFLLGVIPGKRPFKKMYNAEFWSRGHGSQIVKKWKEREVPHIEKPLVTLITPTGDRPEAFALCEKWISNQTQGYFQWIVVDDGKRKTTTTMGQQVVIKRPSNGHTLPVNLSAALPHVQGDFILIIEDDDYYDPDYIKLMVSQLQSSDLVGERGARYYHLPTRTCRHYGEHTHSSFCRTGLRKSVVPLLADIATRSNESIDMKLWDEWKGTKAQWNSSTIGCVGIKGLPGRKSKNATKKESHDINGMIFKKWVKDWPEYTKYMTNVKEPTGAVVSVIFNEYDPPRPFAQDENFPGILLTDKNAEVDGWDVRAIKVGDDPKRESRRLKILACNEFPEYEWILYYDGQLQLLSSPSEWLESVVSYGIADMYVYQHQDRNCVYEEGKEVIRIRKDTKSNVDPQLKKYRRDGVPNFGGLYLGGVHIRRNTPKVREFEKIWWNEVENGSVRDQISLPVALHRSKIKKIVLPAMEWAQHFQRYHHHTNGKIKEKMRTPKRMTH